MQARPSRKRGYLSYLLYGTAALAALAGGTLLAVYTRGHLPSPAQDPASRPAPPSSPSVRAEDAPPGMETAIPHSKGIRVEVLNGCGEAGVVDQFSRLLRKAGFDVIKTGNARSFSHLETMVLDRTGKREDAHEVAKTLGIQSLVLQTKDDPYRIEDVTVIIGRDHRKLGLK